MSSVYQSKEEKKCYSVKLSPNECSVFLCKTKLRFSTWQTALRAAKPIQTHTKPLNYSTDHHHLSRAEQAGGAAAGD